MFRGRSLCAERKAKVLMKSQMKILLIGLEMKVRGGSRCILIRSSLFVKRQHRIWNAFRNDWKVEGKIKRNSLCIGRCGRGKKFRFIRINKRARREDAIQRGYQLVWSELQIYKIGCIYLSFEAARCHA